MRLGIDTFSIRSQGWNAFEIIDYAASLGLQNVHFSERSHLGGLDRDHLERVRRHAELAGLTLEIGMRSFNRLAGTFDPSLGAGEQQLAEMIEAATIIGSPIVRCFIGMQEDRKPERGIAAIIEVSIRTLRAIASRAEAANVTIAVENHGGVDVLAHELRDLIEAVGSSHVRVCLDTGNPMYAAEDAVYATEILAPLTVTTHIRDTRAWLTEDGAMAQWAPLGQGSVDFRRVLDILAREAPESPIDLEVITGGPPRAIDLFNERSAFWDLYPDMPARSLARFLATARGGPVGPIEQMTGGPGSDPAAMKRQQLAHFEESVRFAKEHLGFSA